MDKKETISKILSSYEEIEITDEQEDIVFFLLKGKEYGCWYPKTDLDTSAPLILVKNDEEYDYPHILPTSVPGNKYLAGRFRYVCLYENDSTITFLQTYEEKIIDAIERLMHLLSLSDLEKEEEFQNEFLFYWNDMTDKTVICKLYIGQERRFQKLNAYKSSNEKLRFVSYGLSLCR